MSGAAGLSAAKRRRASTDSLNTNSKPMSSCDIRRLNKEKENAENNTKNLDVNKVSFEQILHFHETRLNSADNNIDSIKEQQYVLDDNMKMLLEANESHFKQIDNDILRLKSKKTTVNDLNGTSEDVKFYKEKISSIEAQLLDLKTLVLKVQNFAMENNLPKQNNVTFSVGEENKQEENKQEENNDD